MSSVVLLVHGGGLHFEWPTYNDQNDRMTETLLKIVAVTKLKRFDERVHLVWLHTTNKTFAATLSNIVQHKKKQPIGEFSKQPATLET